MNTELMKVVQQGEAFAVQSQKAEGGQIKKCNILLQELGGKFETSLQHSFGAMRQNAVSRLGMWWRFACAFRHASIMGRCFRTSRCRKSLS